MKTLNQFLLMKLAEECTEVAQRALKAVQFGLDEIQPGQPFTNEQRLQEELRDLHAITVALQLNGVMPDAKALDDHCLKKYEKLLKYARLSESLGQMDATAVSHLQAFQLVHS